MSCFEDCIYYAECEHRNPNLCGVAAPCSCFPGGDTDNCPVCKGKIWIYPTADEPNCGYPGPAILRLADLGDEQMTILLMWRDRDEELAALEMVENRKVD